MEYKYKAFISYRHVPRDAAAAKALHTAIERYIIPKEQRIDGKRRLGRVFRDEEELPATSDLSAEICDALENAEHLIVVVSPESLASEWVPKEIAYFREHRDEKNILTVLTGGDGKVLFPALMPDMPEPLYIDLSGGDVPEMRRTLKERFLKLCAPLLGCEYDDLFMRDQKRKRRQLRGWLAGITAVASLIIGILAWSNWQINAKNQEILLRESVMLTQEGFEALERNDRFLAVEHAISALPAYENDRPYYGPAEQLLFSALNLFGDHKPTTDYLLNTHLEHKLAVDNICISPNGTRLATIDAFGTITCFDTTSGQILWTKEFMDDDSDANHVLTCTPGNSIIFNVSGTVGSLSWEDGRIIWSEHIDLISPDLFILSGDEKTLAVRLDSAYHFEDTTCNIMFFSAESGELRNTVSIRNEALTDSSVFQGAFSSDGTLFCGVTIEFKQSYSEHLLHFFIVDISVGSLEMIHSISFDSYLREKDVTIAFCEDDTSLMLIFGEASCSTPFTCLKLDLDSQVVLWNTTLQTDPIYDASFQRSKFHLLIYESNIVIGRNRNLFLLDSKSGELLDELNMSMFQSITNSESHANAIVLEQLDDTSFAYVLQNGLYALGNYADGSLNISFWFGHCFDLGKNIDCKLWNGGFFQYVQYLEAYSEYRTGSEAEGMGFAAVLSQDGTTVTIKRPYTHNIDFGQTTIIDAYRDKDPEELYDEFPVSDITDGSMHSLESILENDGSITIRNTSNGKSVHQIKTGLPRNSIRLHSLVLEEQYLLLLTKHNSLWLYDIKKEDFVLQHDLTYWLTNVFCWEDPKENRMYVFGDNHLLCIDMRSWTVLTDIIGIIYFDTETGLIHREVYIEPARSDLVIFHLPTTEELVAIGRQFLGE